MSSYSSDRADVLGPEVSPALEWVSGSFASLESRQSSLVDDKEPTENLQGPAGAIEKAVMSPLRKGPGGTSGGWHWLENMDLAAEDGEQKAGAGSIAWLCRPGRQRYDCKHHGRTAPRSEVQGEARESALRKPPTEPFLFRLSAPRSAGTLAYA